MMIETRSIRQQVKEIWDRALEWEQEKGYFWVAGYTFDNKLDAIIAMREIERQQKEVQ
ncbi:MAG: hypothetical protein V4568_18090 [Pseudomonadota bacterium]